MNIVNFAQFVAYSAIYFALAVFLTRSLNWRAGNHFDAAASIANGNAGLGFRRAGAQIGLAIAMLGVLLGGVEHTFFADVISSVGYGVLALVFIWVSLMVIDKLILPKVDNNAEVGKGNISVGIVEFGTLVSTGVLAFSSIYGDGGNFIGSILYFIVGQVTMVGLILAYEQVIKVDLVGKIADGEIASGVYLAGKVIAYSLILVSAIKGNNYSLDIVQNMTEFVIAASIGFAFLYVAELLIDLVIISQTSVREMLEDNNTAAVLQLSGVKIGMALILGFAVL